MAANDAQLVRLLALIPYLQSHPGIGLDEAARTFGVAPEQIVADLNIVWLCGLPGQYGGDLIDVDMELVEGEGVIHLSNAEYLARPLTLTPDEAFSLMLALEYVGGLTETGLSDAAASALAKLRGALGERALEAGTVRVATAGLPVRDAVAEAIERGRALELVYDGQHRYSTPLVDPARVVVRHGIAYLQAWSHPRQDWRTYRMERIADASVSDVAAADHGPAPEVPSDWNQALPFSSEATLELTDSGRWVAEYYPTRAVEPLPDGRLRVRLGVVDEGWLTALLLRLGPAVLAVAPAAAAGPAREAAAATLELYAEAAGRLAP